MIAGAHQIQCRRAESADFPALADLRYRLTTDHASGLDERHKAVFLQDCRQRLSELDSASSVVHWVAEAAGKLISVLSIVTVSKLPDPHDSHACWGYLTNVYTLPEHRNTGVGSALLEHAKRYASQEHMELLIVWPSDRSVPFYQRAGFMRMDDPLVLPLPMSAGSV